jgi:hypothetical protein
MQKNEDHLLEIWLKYYADLVGAKGIFLIDNGSISSKTIGIIDEHKKTGINYLSFDKSEDFENKGLILWKVACECFKNGYKLAFFPDIDEILAVSDRGTPILKQESVLNEFNRLLSEPESIFRVGTGWFNIPHTSKVSESPHRNKKVIIRHDATENLVLDLGCHLWDWSKNCDVTSFGEIGATSFGVIHFHYRPYEEWVDRAKIKMNKRMSSFSPEECKKYRGAGMHLAQGLLKSRSQYYSDCLRQLRGGIEIGKLFTDANLPVPFSDGELEDFTEEHAAHFPEHPHFDAAGREAFKVACEKCRCYLEYGVGGSTNFVAKNHTDTVVIGVHTDLNYIQAAQKVISSPQVHLEWCDLGPVGEWGFPVNKDKMINYWSYMVQPWRIANKLGLEPDLVLIDGRFRVAAFLYSLLNARDGALILFDDYVERSYYHVVEKIIKPTETAGHMAIFQKRKTYPTTLFVDLIVEHAVDPR